MNFRSTCGKSTLVDYCCRFDFPRCLRTLASSFLRCSGVNFTQRIFANPDASGFFAAAFFGGLQRARAAARISSLRSSGDTLAHRFFAPLRPPSLCFLLTDFFEGNSKV